MAGAVGGDLLEAVRAAAAVRRARSGFSQVFWLVHLIARRACNSLALPWERDAGVRLHHSQQLIRVSPFLVVATPRKNGTGKPQGPDIVVGDIGDDTTRPA
ncbi:hypothetical protein [Roseitranquillus sediminis]|uniref:hypothetical protein n=1 Tax=Roseitranquillus sediminis TaxID=2809051 RepID=UPI001D0CA6D2|nr:hypothetical protein [Roseitranquillus sediminis]MBM9593423.1 hypothetical protein [Roseitranquillus sediminis]